MTRSQIERNRPFIIKTADENAYKMPHRDHIVLPPRAAYVIVFDLDDPMHSMCYRS